ncbi:hypothetical protein JZU51_00760, partial [bacterium]|nr:hypothetical protein [bacterium]
MERKVQENKEDAGSIACLVGRAAILSDAANETRSRKEAAKKADHEHPSPGVDLVVHPGAER